MRALETAVRKHLSDSVLAARRASESASRAAITGLGVFAERRPEHLDEEQAALRNGLRAKWRQLGRDEELLIAECAYEQWHRLLFARFLAENELLLHPRYRAPLKLDECDELAAELGEPDGWSVAARFAAEILPGIFRLDDPCVRLRLAPEGRDALERILAAIPAEVFVADDALGWVYQFWQKDKKDEINAAERKIGGADLGPVTQLFTENYMVRFLLENSLGAWWASRHPESPLIKDFDYLRFDDDGKPAAGSFEEWPAQVAEVTVMDPCCGSGHFLVEAFSMLWRMRAEEEGLEPTAAQDAVLRDNLFGLELDPRCVQIAMFALALQAWRAGGGWRQLPVPNVACSGIPVKAPVEDWTALAKGDERLENALVRLHILFQEADTLGSLIDPKRATEISDPTGLQRSVEDVDWEEVAPLIRRAAEREATDPATAVLGADVAGVARAAELLSRSYWLVATNPPFLPRGKFGTRLTQLGDRQFQESKNELATMCLERVRFLANRGGAYAVVMPQTWLILANQEVLRVRLLAEECWRVLARLGLNSFGSIASGYVDVFLGLWVRKPPRTNAITQLIDAKQIDGRAQKATQLMAGTTFPVLQASFLTNPDARVLWEVLAENPPLRDYAQAHQGLKTGDNPRYLRSVWEMPRLLSGWELVLSSPGGEETYSGRSTAVLWEEGRGTMSRSDSARIQGTTAWGRPGVAISEMGYRYTSLYLGEKFESSAIVMTAEDPENVAVLWSFINSSEFDQQLAIINPKLSVSTSNATKVPFDVDHWRKVAEEQYPDGLPEPYSNDPTQWLFEGRPEDSTDPLQVAVGRLLGYRWPEQPESDDLDPLTDTDGIVCLPSVKGEPPAVDRLNTLLAAAFGESWSAAQARQLIEESGSKKKSLADWLRDDFFEQHCAVFGKRPFVWHIWDGQRDGFSALVNYHCLDYKNLERLTYTYLGQDWVERQRAAVKDEVAGAEKRLAAALELQGKLEAILEGEPPYDIYVRWKELREQPIGWNPDLNDGVRLNIRPFVEAGVLRSKFRIHWRKDRGKNPDGSERHNDLHLSIAEKQAAREGVA